VQLSLQIDSWEQRGSNVLAALSAARGTVRAMLTVKDKMTLDFERRWWKYSGAKEAAVGEQFGESMTRYYQRLNALMDHPAAVAHSPLLVKRLRRLRAARARARSQRRIGFEDLR
jgi:predicted secreted hydrolase